MTTKAGRLELPTHASTPISVQPRGFDLFRLPGLRRFIRWKYARFVFQLPLLILALFVIVDGLTGNQLAPRNVATTAVWLHYRGLVAIALAIFGNAFCAACPLMLTRGATKRLERLLPNKFSFPMFLRNKYFVTALMLFYFFSYEYFDLWASPWLTAWLAVGYFGAALVIDTLFPAGTFCRYVCPLGNFNFVMASASPTQITALDHDVCRACEHKPCLQGRYSSEQRVPSTEKQSLGTRHSSFTNQR
jgi:polyferredoxin